MPSKLNFRCKRLFLEFSVEKYPLRRPTGGLRPNWWREVGMKKVRERIPSDSHKNSTGTHSNRSIKLSHSYRTLREPFSYRTLFHEPLRPSFEFAKYLLLSKAFLYLSKHPDPIFELAIAVNDHYLIGVVFYKVDKCPESDRPYYYFNMTFGNFRMLLKFVNPSVIRVILKSRVLHNEVTAVLDDYEGTLRLDSYDDKHSIKLLNRWNQKISSVVSKTKNLLLSEDIFPLDLDYYDCLHLATQNEVLRIFDRHKIERISTSLSFRGNSCECWKKMFLDKEREMPSNNIKSLKHLDVLIELDELRSFANFLVKNEFSLTKLAPGIVTETFSYLDFDSILNKFLTSYDQLLEFKGQCSNLTQELCIGHYLAFKFRDSSKFKQEWIEKLLQCAAPLKDAHYTTEYDGRFHYLRKRTVDGLFTLNLTVVFMYTLNPRPLGWEVEPL